MTIELTEDQLAAIIEAVADGLEDRQNYMRDGNPEVDYGDEWPEIARREALRWRECAHSVRALQAPGIANMCEALAEDLIASANEFHNEEVGN